MTKYIVFKIQQILSSYIVVLSLVVLVATIFITYANCWADVLESSVHKGFGCQVCHKKSKESGLVACSMCHEREAEVYNKSIHARVNKKNVQNASCSDCHGSHDILPASDPRSKVSSSHVSSTCGRCHPHEETEYSASIHWEIYMDDPDSAPGCQTCHGDHGVDDVMDRRFVITVTNTCASCHQGAFNTYKETLHGQVMTLEASQGATCWDCHSSHKILETSDPDSPLSSDSRSATCKKCHGSIGPFFIAYWPHADIHDKKNYPLLYYAYIMMKLLFLLVMVTASIHTLAWVRGFPKIMKTRIERPKGRRYVYYLRFQAWHRLTHFILFISVIGLAVSGLPLRYSGTGWAHRIAEIIGGFKNIDTLHKCMAALLFLAVALHGYYLISLIREKGVRGFFRFLFSPDSLFPRLEDFKEAWAEFQCFLKGTLEPERDRWSYWEKFDYWAVFWGMFVIGGSGLMLAFPEVTTRFFPGWILNVALIFHSEEALLAIFFLFIFHFFHAHLRPLKFPIDESIFTGRISEEDYFNERQLEVARKSPDELEKLKVGPPSLFFRLAVYIVSFIAVDIGLVLIACILYTAWETGKILP